MPYQLGSGSRKELEGVHPDLIRVVERAIALSEQDFSVHDGVRSVETQRKLVARGVSKTMDSKHIPQADGFSHAVDLVPFEANRLVWEWELIYPIAAAVRQAADELGVDLRWGGIWDRKMSELPDGPAAIRDAVADYVARRKKAGKSAFLDGPHYELA